MNEIWKDVRDYEGFYRVSNLGRVMSLHWNKERIINGTKNGDGYIQVQLSKKGQKDINPGIHRLIFEAFYRRLLPNEQVHHINEIRDDNRSINIVARDGFEHNSFHHKGKISQNKGKKMSSQSIAKRQKTKEINGTLHKKRSKQSIQKQMQTRIKNGKLKHTEQSKKLMSQKKKKWWAQRRSKQINNND